jgi:diadenosine tetraphosphate (Ap4A) HIT family hydrolase
MSGFVLHPRLAADTAFVADWRLSRVLLMDDARYPWLVLVPRRADVTEQFELMADDRAVLTEEIAHAAHVLKTLSAAQKINIGALGNMVPQLHIHIVARNEGDAAWPGPVWGHGTAVRYEPARRDAFVEELRAKLADSRVI